MNWFDLKSFLLGILSASIIWAYFYRNRNQIKKITRVVKQKNKEAEITDVKGIDELIRSELFRDTQHNHLASQLFPLNHIFIEPELMAYPFTDADEMGDPPIIDQLIPYLPDCPELSGIFDLHGIPLRNILNTPTKTILIGPFGSGKSSLLAFMAGKFSQNEIGSKRFENFIPFYLHASDISINPKEIKPPEQIILDSIASKFNPVLRSKIIRHLTSYLSKNQVILLYDGLDEFSEKEFDQHAELLNSFSERHPKIRIITSATPAYLGKLPGMGFYPIILKGWSQHKKQALFHKWSTLWSYDLFSETAENQHQFQKIVESWLVSDRTQRNPLEITLKVWATLSGDTVGESYTADIESYFRRLTGGNISHSAIEALAYAFSRNQTTVLPQTNLEMMLIKSQFKLRDSSTSEITSAELGNGKRSRKEGSSGLTILNKLLSVGFLDINSSENIKFRHPTILSYFAGFSTINQEPELDSLSSYPRAAATYGFAAALQKEPTWVYNFLKSDSSDQLHKNIRLISQWLKYTNADTVWRTEAIKRLISMLQNEKLPQPLRYRAFSGLITTNDQMILKVFPKLLNAKSAEQRKFGALGSGLVSDKKVQTLLENSTNDDYQIASYAAIIGLSMHQSNHPHRVLRQYILNTGDESGARTAAEGLARINPEGYEILKELAQSENIVIRRSAVFGLAAVRERWSTQLLEDISLEDNEWIIRTTASRLLETLQSLSYAVPRPLTPFTNAGWLVKYAASNGQGISPGIPPIDILLSALKDEDSDLQWNALNYLRLYSDEEIVHATMKCYFNPKTSVGTARSTDYNLWLYSVSKN